VPARTTGITGSGSERGTGRRPRGGCWESPARILDAAAAAAAKGQRDTHHSANHPQQHDYKGSTCQTETERTVVMAAHVPQHLGPEREMMEHYRLSWCSVEVVVVVVVPRLIIIRLIVVVVVVVVVRTMESTYSDACRGTTRDTIPSKAESKAEAQSIDNDFRPFFFFFFFFAGSPRR
jgi:hypothetical protein